ncbi:hypothetical protein NL676_018488 [Syzygium grande]|nr:hypothetical protein NL676_018488 [Syzygium grande]
MKIRFLANVIIGPLVWQLFDRRHLLWNSDGIYPGANAGTRRRGGGGGGDGDERELLCGGEAAALVSGWQRQCAPSDRLTFPPPLPLAGAA